MKKLILILIVSIVFGCQKETDENIYLFRASITTVGDGDCVVSYKYNNNDLVYKKEIDSITVDFDYLVGDTVKILTNGFKATTTIRLNGHIFRTPINHCGDFKAILLIN